MDKQAQVIKIMHNYLCKRMRKNTTMQKSGGSYCKAKVYIHIWKYATLDKTMQNIVKVYNCIKKLCQIVQVSVW